MSNFNTVFCSLEEASDCVVENGASNSNLSCCFKGSLACEAGGSASR